MDADDKILELQSKLIMNEKLYRQNLESLMKIIQKKSMEIEYYKEKYINLANLYDNNMGRLEDYEQYNIIHKREIYRLDKEKKLKETMIKKKKKKEGLDKDDRANTYSEIADSERFKLSGINFPLKSKMDISDQFKNNSSSKNFLRGNHDLDKEFSSRDLYYKVPKKIISFD